MLCKAEGRYCVTHKQHLAIVYCVRNCKHYLLGRPCLIRTDHQPLKWLSTLKEPTGQLAHWLEFLQGFDFKIGYCPGTRHGNADGMSCIPCHPQQCQCHYEIDELPCSPCNKCLRRSSPDVVKVSAVSTRQANSNQLSDPAPWTDHYTAVQLREFQLQDKQIAPVLI